MIRAAMIAFLNDRQSYCSPTTVDWYRFMLAPLLDRFTSTPLPDIRAADLHAYLTDQRARPLAPSTIAGIVRATRIFFAWCVTQSRISADPASTLKAPRAHRIPKALTPDQLHRLIALAEQSTPRDRALIFVALSTGCRASELLSLTTNALHLPDHQLHVTGKGNKQRVVAISPRASKALRHYLGARTGHVFLTDDAHPLTYSGLRQICRRFSQRLGFRITAHMLRHTFATHAIANGMEVSHAQQLLGHAHISTTQAYAEGARVAAALKAHKKTAPL